MQKLAGTSVSSTGCCCQPLAVQTRAGYPRRLNLLHTRNQPHTHLRASPESGADSRTPSSTPVDAPPPAAAASTRLFSNLNPKTLRHEPGTVLGSALLVAGTTVGAGILALPAVTSEAGFLASTATITVCCAFSIATGLLVAEVNLNTICELGAGGVSLTTMARRTLGPTGSTLASAAYVFLHYALLVAYISKAGEIVSGWSGWPLLPSAGLFAAAFGGLCYFSSSKQMDTVNGGLVGLVVVSFMGLLATAAGGVHPAALLTSPNWAAVPATLPVVALAFVYHNVVPVVTTSLEGDVGKIRTAIITGVLIPYAMFVSWEGAILGSADLGAAGSGTGGSSSSSSMRSGEALSVASSSNGRDNMTGSSSSSSSGFNGAISYVSFSSSNGNEGGNEARPHLIRPTATTAAAAAATGSLQLQYWLPAPDVTAIDQQEEVPPVTSSSSSYKLQSTAITSSTVSLSSDDATGALRDTTFENISIISSSSSEPPTRGFTGHLGSSSSGSNAGALTVAGTADAATVAPLEPSTPSRSSQTETPAAAAAAAAILPVPAAPAPPAPAPPAAAAASDPLEVLSRTNPLVGPLVQGFSFLAIATSYIGFILGLTDFLADALRLPTGRQAPLPYLLTLLPPFGFAVTNPNVFLKSLDAAGTYGVLTLFGILPAAMAWSERYADSTLTKTEIVPGGRPVLLVVGGTAAAVIIHEVMETISGAGAGM